MKKVVIFIVLLCILFSLSACGNENAKDEVLKELSFELRGYLSSMWFHNHSGENRDRSFFINQGYTHVIFVHSEEEFLKGGFADDAVVAWPSLYTLLMLDGINSWIRENEDHNEILLSYPVTTRDMFDNWENIHRFMRDGVTSTTTRSNLIAPLVREEYSRIINSELERLNEAIEASDIDVSLYGLGLPFTWRNLAFSDNLILIFEVYAKLDEDVRKQLDIPYMYAEFRAVRRAIEWEDSHPEIFRTPRDQVSRFPESYTGQIRIWEFW